MNDCMVWLTGATVLGFVFGHWLGARWGIRHARISQKLTEGWHIQLHYRNPRTSHP